MREEPAMPTVSAGAARPRFLCSPCLLVIAVLVATPLLATMVTEELIADAKAFGIAVTVTTPAHEGNGRDRPAVPTTEKRAKKSAER